ncbi:carbohydrate kinase family protein [Silvibacterium dinghuense]|uniref:Carbohydrate kinase family protein n=1 Tax=Silvibacterium dinghuense TaxID=1560006 RepID=A0A4Q1SB81_9BACT|nr:carbohydrate kinase family protein [Silvibacterium dinghuense]RXS94388.1 carbohydrate kinase family protein [Silvibacterium dinghuense]
MKQFDVIVPGEINLDLILAGLPEEMPLERELLGDDFAVTLGSSSAILAHNLAVLGARVGFITCTGGDDFGRLALERLGASGVDLSQCFHSRRGIKTGVTLLLPHGKERHILTYQGTMAEMAVADLDLNYLKSARHVHVSSLYLQTALAPGLPALFRELKNAGVTLSLDTNDDPADQWGAPLEELLPLVDFFFPNEQELLRITGKPNLDEALEAIGKLASCVVVKCGARGSVVQTREGRIVAEATPVTPVDTIGAGDSFNAGFLAAWLRGLDLKSCAYAGNITGALSTQRPGGTDAFRNPGLVKHFFEERAFPFPVETSR